MNANNIIKIKGYMIIASVILLFILLFICGICALGMLDAFGFITGLIVFGSVLLLCVDCFIACEFFEISTKKGYADVRYFWYCFIFGIIGYLVVIALPNKIAVKNSVSDELPEI